MKPAAALLVLSGTLAFGQSSFSNAMTLPLLDDDLSFRVPVTVSGETNYFLVDTGATVTTLDLRYRDRLGAPVRQWDGHNLYRSPELALGNLALGLDEVICTDMKLFRLISGEPCDGILGMDFLKKHIMELDFDRGVIVIAKEISPQVRTNASRIPMKISNIRHFRVPTVINGKVTLDLLVDTADSSTLSLKKADWDRVYPPDEKAPVHKLLLAGINKKVTESVMARLPIMEVQSNKYSNVVCVLSLYDTAPSALGMGFFRQHHVTFDFLNTNLYLAPAKAFGMPEEHDMSGLHLLREQGQTLVHSVDEGSPAALAGVRPGDRIATINGLISALLKMKHVRRILKMEPGEKISMLLNRGENQIPIEFRLKKFL